MTRVSTNAGKNPFSRSDFDYFPTRNPDRKAGLKLDMTIKPKFKTIVNTGYKDKKGKIIHFNDVVTFQKNDYLIQYNSKEFYWILVNLIDGENVLKLAEMAQLIHIKTKYNKFW